MDGTPNLERLGKRLLERRTELGLRRAELGRRIGVSATYIGLVERAQPRREGRAGPSRPTVAVLRAWARALDMDVQETREVLNLAGHRVHLSGDGLDAVPTGATGLRERQGAYGPIEEDALVERVRDVLRLARLRGMNDEALQILDEVVQLVQFRLEHSD